MKRNPNWQVNQFITEYVLIFSKSLLVVYGRKKVLVFLHIEVYFEIQ